MDSIEVKRQRARDWYRKNKSKSLAWGKSWKERNRDRVNACARKAYAKNRDKRKAYAKNWWNKNPIKKRDYWYKTKYGIGYSHYKILEAEQNNQCAICKQSEQHYQTLCLDHDHKTGKIRGLLCHNCNSALGLIHDSLAVVDSMKTYLVEHKNG